MPVINGNRLLADLRRLAEFGRYKTGVHRPTYSPQDMKARRWVSKRMAEAGLEPVIDRVGNVIGRSRSERPRLLIGSHIESQPYAGWLDGSLGVMCGIEVVRSFAEDSACAGLAIDVAAWADEEGYFLSFLGSRSFCDDLSQTELEAIKSREEDILLIDALKQVGLADRPLEQLDPTHYTGFLELHIEQGDYLDASDRRLGIVTSIVGSYQYRIRFTGEQNHAGTTRMAIRKDAGVALVNLCHAIGLQFPSVAGPRSVWTTGHILLEPGAPSVVPGAAEMYFQFRDADIDYLQSMDQKLRELVTESNRNGPCSCQLEVVSRSSPALMNAEFQDALEQAAEVHAPGLHTRMPSAAGHDAQILSKRMDTAMLFVPSIGGISHHYAENTRDEDIVLGCQVMADAATDILRRAR